MSLTALMQSSFISVSPRPLNPATCEKAGGDGEKVRSSWNIVTCNRRIKNIGSSLWGPGGESEDREVEMEWYT